VQGLHLVALLRRLVVLLRLVALDAPTQHAQTGESLFQDFPTDLSQESPAEIIYETGGDPRFHPVCVARVPTKWRRPPIELPAEEQAACMAKYTTAVAAARREKPRRAAEAFLDFRCSCCQTKLQIQYNHEPLDSSFTSCIQGRARHGHTIE
jgi:hypothetical protein